MYEFLLVFALLLQKPYICTVEGCTKRYTDPSSLRKHKKTCHPEHFNGAKKVSKSLTPVPSKLRFLFKLMKSTIDSTWIRKYANNGHDMLSGCYFMVFYVI